jgi:HD superfamily phosphohydrolase YqeK
MPGRWLSLTGTMAQFAPEYSETNYCGETGSKVRSWAVGHVANWCLLRNMIPFDADPDMEEISIFLHDISAVFPSSERISISMDLQIEILPEEEIFPMIIHQKISKVTARDIFKITDTDVLDVVGCHTTILLAVAAYHCRSFT